jgi:hypothetical protein
LERIKNYWLDRDPPWHGWDYSAFRYLLLDATYFHKDNCLVLVVDPVTQLVLQTTFIKRECYEALFPMISQLNLCGLHPSALVSDGHKTVLHALHDTWPNTIYQRCLYHIQRQGMAWIRFRPKTQAGKDLRRLLANLTSINTLHKRKTWVYAYRDWLKQHRDFVASLPNTSVAFKDLKRTMALINNALPNMFHFLKIPSLPSTNNLLEGIFSRLKADFRRHRGLSHKHKRSYFIWYFFFKNEQKTNTL